MNYGMLKNVIHLISEHLAKKLTPCKQTGNRNKQIRAQAGKFWEYNNYSRSYRIYIEVKNATICRTVKFIKGANNIATTEQNQIIEEK